MDLRLPARTLVGPTHWMPAARTLGLWASAWCFVAALGLGCGDDTSHGEDSDAFDVFDVADGLDTPDGSDLTDGDDRDTQLTDVQADTVGPDDGTDAIDGLDGTDSGNDTAPDSSGDDTVADTSDVPMGPRCGFETCALGETCCNYVCVDLEADLANCGACGTVCGAGESCVGGVCRCGDHGGCGTYQACCPDSGGTLWCSYLGNDTLNCGACGNVCASTERCYGGQCLCYGSGHGEVCGANEVCCGGIGCTDLDVDPLSCGACGVACGPGEQCTQGRCGCGAQVAAGSGPACGSGQACCGDPATCQAAGQCACGTSDCGAGQACCDVDNGSGGTQPECVSTWRDTEHCGTCGAACGAGQRCHGGLCECQAWLADCDGSPSTGCETRLTTDREHCGACNAACPPGEVCGGAAQCGLDCAQGLVKCGDSCVDPYGDRFHCGTCNNACPSGELCDGYGQCAIVCAPGRTQCGDACANLRDNRLHCGACGHVCAPGEVCDGTGQCALSCQVGFTNCGGTCVDVRWDQRHCGTCSNPCGSGEVCNGLGQCQATCAAGFTDCSGRCVDTNSNRAHCGGCDLACPSGLDCVAGFCAPDCPAYGLDTCGDQCVDLDSDSAHCGTCGLNCPTGEHCEGGLCGLHCDTIGLDECDGACTDLTSDPLHCGACATTCDALEACVGGVCIPACNAAGLTECSGACVDLASDPAHCGDCATACGVGELCEMGVCVDLCPTCRGFLDVAAAGGHTCAIYSDAGQKSVVCWGSNDQGQLGAVTPVPWSSTPVVVDTSAVAPTAVPIDVEVGERHSCVIFDDGRPACWGSNGSGRLGDGTTTGGPTPRLVALPNGTTVVQIAPGTTHTCALDDTGQSWCWGDNAKGQLGIGTSGSWQSTPTVTLESTAGIQIEAGDGFTCEILLSGEVSCWGTNSHGQLGQGVAYNAMAGASQPVTVPGLKHPVNARDLAVGRGHVCVLVEDVTSGSPVRNIWCWGDDGFDQVPSATQGSGASVGCLYGGPGPAGFCKDKAVLSPVPFGAGWVPGTAGKPVDIDAGGAHTCAVVDAAGTRSVYCWGDGIRGQLGEGACPAGTKCTDRVVHAMPTLVPGVSNAVVVSSGINLDEDRVSAVRPDEVGVNEHTCVLTDAAGIRCWGANLAGEVGDGVGGTTTPRRAAGLTDAVGLDVQESLTCAERGSGSLACWGAISPPFRGSGGGGIGWLNGSRVPFDEPADATTASSGGWAAGRRLYGIEGGVVKSWSPRCASCEATPGPTTVLDGASAPVAATTLFASNEMACAIQPTTDQLWCWGDQQDLFVLPLGRANPTDAKPAPVVDLTNTPITAVAADLTVVLNVTAHGCAIRTDGSVVCWGSNDHGQLGNGSTAASERAVVVSGVVGATEIAVGTEHSCALTSGGMLCWGGGTAGQLGQGTDLDSLVPVAPALPSGFTPAHIAVGFDTTCAVDATGDVLCWGANTDGQLGDGTDGDALLPVPILTGEGVVALDCGSKHCCGVTGIGETWCWGYARWGGLGDGTLLYDGAGPLVDYQP